MLLTVQKAASGLLSDSVQVWLVVTVSVGPAQILAAKHPAIVDPPSGVNVAGAAAAGSAHSGAHAKSTDPGMQ